MSKPRLSLAALCLASFAFLSCDGSGSTSPGAPPKDGSELPTFAGNLATYRISDGVLTLDWGKTVVDTLRFCQFEQALEGQPKSDSLIVEPYTYPRTESVLIRRAGDELTVYFSTDTSLGNYVFAMHFLRLGEGTGLVGEWRADEYRMRETEEWASFGKVQLAEQIDTRLEITADTYRWVHRERISWAASEVLVWNRSTWNEKQLPQTAYYDIEVTEIDPETVQSRGRKTGEVLVRKRIRAGTRYTHSGDVQVSSSDPSHKPFVIKEHPETCPVYPQWYGEFLVANAKPNPDTLQTLGRTISPTTFARRL